MAQSYKDIFQFHLACGERVRLTLSKKDSIQVLSTFRTIKSALAKDFRAFMMPEAAMELENSAVKSKWADGALEVWLEEKTRRMPEFEIVEFEEEE